ncbi:MAG: hypothetical protein NWS49_06440 [Opitutales bacterium]|nr:hypothetical protein [Opitutales bacterium]
MDHRKNQRQGFSLILSLTMMAGIVLLVISLSAFITIESRAAMNQQLATRARLNALVSMRLALAHLQQEAGPDRRSTARADITQPNVSADSLRNPMWTGVWRTDQPDLPPAWLVSGRGDQPAGTQMISLFQAGATPDYHEGYWAPWQALSAAAAANSVPLVGTGSALAAADGKASGLVSLPKVTLPDDDVAGTYAYWIGDEGLKARINLADDRSKPYGDVDQLAALRSGLTPRYDALPGLGSLSSPDQLRAVDSVRQLALLSGFQAGTDANNVRRLFHDVTVVSAGVLADSAQGGLKRDLSRAFELTDEEFNATEFGAGATGAAATHTGTGVAAVTMPVLKESGSNNLRAAPVFNRSITGGGNLRGPTWWALRDYHRLYRQLGWSAGSGGAAATTIPTLNARTLWPNVAAAHPSGPPADSGLPNNSLRNRIYGYSDLYDGDLPTPIDPNISDLLNGDAGRLITRPLNVAATPYVQRVSLAFSVNKMHWFGPWITYRVGRQVYRYREETIDIRLNITPIVVVHNPYNVRMAWKPGAGATGSPNKRPFAAAISLSDMNDWKFRFKQYQADTMSNPAVMETNLTDFFKRQSNEVHDDDTLRIYLSKDGTPDMVLEPGEFRVFSCEPTFGEWTKSIVLDNTYDTRGGYRDNVWDWNFGEEALDSLDIDAPISFEIIPGGRLRMRQALACWPGDQLVLDEKTNKSGNEVGNDKNDFFYRSSEASEVVFSDINQGKYPSPGEKFFPSWRHVQDKFEKPNDEWDGRTPYPTPTSPPLEPDLVTVIDITAKPADAADAPFPLLTHSNPFAATARASGGGRSGAGDDRGFLGASPSYQFTVRSGDWVNILANHESGRLAYGGSSLSTSGAKQAVLLEVPLVAPTSLAQYAHANFGVRDQQPLLSIGNSFASPFVDAQKVFQQNGPNWTEADQTYLLNAALWDGYFLSGLGPRMRTGGSGSVTPADPVPATPANATGGGRPTAADPNVATDIPAVIEAFINGDAPLANPRFSHELSSLGAEAKTLALNDHRRVASVLLNEGAFNVNSTSVEAWTAFLGAAKGQALAGVGANSPSPTNNARFPRSLAKVASTAASGDAIDESNWQGFANLSDAQLEALAKAIVAENKARFALQSRTERELSRAPGSRLFGGLTQPVTPYLGLAEFINRFLTPETWANRCGALQAAILRADQQHAAGISDRLFAGLPDLRVTPASLQTPTAGIFPHPENLDLRAQGGGTSRAHAALGAPGNLLQSDLLQTLGPALATRSDTFTLRCFGEASALSGENGMAWMEVVVQRVPDFVDPTNPAETSNSAPKPLAPGPATADASVSPELTPINQLLGRRFKVLSMRWIQGNEI